MAALHGVAIVVGVGSEQGLGAALSRRFAREGYSVIVSGRTKAKLARGRGTIAFTGATASLRGRPPFTAFASAKAGLRSLAQSMAREFGPLGIHVGHVVIDGGIDGERLNAAAPQLKINRGTDGLLNIDAIADAYWHLHRQHPSAWTHELDLRPFKEPF
jgi:NAD(P)-dependent dehydrogenase (short-subunit alcohol dehydrogenase family)